MAERTKLYFRESGEKQYFDADVFLTELRRALESEKFKSENDDVNLVSLVKEGLEHNPESFRCVHKWDESTYRDSAPAGDIYTQWNRMFAQISVGCKSLAIELHYQEEDVWCYKPTMLKHWLNSDQTLVPTDFTTDSVNRGSRCEIM